MIKLQGRNFYQKRPIALFWRGVIPPATGGSDSRSMNASQIFIVIDLKKMADFLLFFVQRQKGKNLRVN